MNEITNGGIHILDSTETGPVHRRDALAETEAVIHGCHHIASPGEITCKLRKTWVSLVTIEESTAMHKDKQWTAWGGLVVFREIHVHGQLQLGLSTLELLFLYLEDFVNGSARVRIGYPVSFGFGINHIFLDGNGVGGILVSPCLRIILEFRCLITAMTEHRNGVARNFGQTQFAFLGCQTHFPRISHHTPLIQVIDTAPLTVRQPFELGESLSFCRRQTIDSACNEIDLISFLFLLVFLFTSDTQDECH